MFQAFFAMSIVSLPPLQNLANDLWTRQRNTIKWHLIAWLMIIHCCYIAALVLTCFCLMKGCVMFFLKYLLQFSCSSWCYFIKWSSINLQIVCSFVMTAASHTLLMLATVATVECPSLNYNSLVALLHPDLKCFQCPDWHLYTLWTISTSYCRGD